MERMVAEFLVAKALAQVTTASQVDPWRSGDLTHLLHSGQQRIYERIQENRKQPHVILCARGYGKTYLACWLADRIARSKSKAKVKIGTEFQTDLESLIIPNYDAVLETCPEELRPVWKATRSKYIYPNGSEVALVGLDRKPNGLRGQHGVDAIILEEAGFISKLEAIYRSVIVPITTHRPDCDILLVSTPPESVDHYFWTFVDQAELDGSLSTFTIDENPMLTPEQVKGIEEKMKEGDTPGRETTAFRREYLCQRISEVSRMIVPEAQDLDQWTVALERPNTFPFLLKHHALDSGVRDLTVGLWAYYDFVNGRTVIEGELMLKGKDVLTKTIFEKTREIETKLGYLRVTRHADNDNLILINDLNMLAVESKLDPEKEPDRHWVPTRKDELEASINLVRTQLKAGRVLISPNCKVLLGTLKTALWNKQRTDIQRSEVYGHGDAIMALVYLLRNVDRHTNPIPQTFMADLDNSIIFQRETRSQAAKSLTQSFNLKRS